MFKGIEIIMIEYNNEFWDMLDELVQNSEIVIDRPRGSVHPRYNDFIYGVDYGYLRNTSSMDGSGIDIWLGTKEDKRVDAIICTVDLTKKDSEIKVLIGCTNKEKEIIYKTHNRTSLMKGLFVDRAD